MSAGSVRAASSPAGRGLTAPLSPPVGASRQVGMSTKSSDLSGENRCPAPLHAQECTHHGPD